MKNLKKALLILLGLSLWAAADSSSRLNIEEEDGSPSTYPYKLKVTNGSLTDNGDGTASLATGSGGGGGGGSGSTTEIFVGPVISSPNVSVSANSSQFSGSVSGSTFTFTLKSSSVTLQGNTFNASNKLVQFDGSTNYPIGNGQNITNLPAANLSGDVPAASLTTNGILNTPTLQSGAQFHISTGAVDGNFQIIGNTSLYADAIFLPHLGSASGITFYTPNAGKTAAIAAPYNGKSRLRITETDGIQTSQWNTDNSSMTVTGVALEVENDLHVRGDWIAGNFQWSKSLSTMFVDSVTVKGLTAATNQTMYLGTSVTTVTVNGSEILSGNVAISPLTSGQCVQTGTGGLLTVSGAACSIGNISSVTGNFTLASTSTVVLANASGASLTVTLPTAVGITGKTYTIKRTSSGANTVTLATTSAQTVDDATTVVLTAQYASLDVISDGANWQIK